MPDDQAITKMDVPELRDKLLDIVRRFPENVNPQAPSSYGGGPYCLYDDGEGNHCLIGQLAFEQGWRVPEYSETMSADKAAAVYGWPVSTLGMDYLARIQDVADYGLNDMPDEPIRWGHEGLKNELESWANLAEKITKAAGQYQ